MNAVIFVRVSRKDMDYQRQITDLEAIAATRNLRVVQTITEKISGAKKNKSRPAIQSLVDGAKAGKYGTVLVSEVTRLGRNTREVLDVVEDLTDLGVNIFIQAYGIETIVNGKRNPIAQLMVTLLSEFGRLEREFLIDRTRSGLEQAKRNGKTLGRPHGTKKPTEELLQEYKGIVKSLTKGLSVREAAKVNDVAINTVMKVKRAMVKS